MSETGKPVAVGLPVTASGDDSLGLAPTLAPEDERTLGLAPTFAPEGGAGEALGLRLSSGMAQPSDEFEWLTRTVGDIAVEAKEGEGLCGTRVQHFQLRELLGEGGMGQVYLAHDLSLDRPVALKMIRFEDPSPSVVDRFVYEARAQARLNHPNVVAIHYIGVHQGLYFFAMEVVEGGTLDDRLADETSYPWEEALEAMIQVARALRQAHRAGLIHRDIKPSNLLVGEDALIKVADFGLATRSAEEGTGGFVGTPLYVSPEQAQGEACDHRADMYSMGATFYHLLAGAPPFEGQSFIQLLHHHTQTPPPSLEKVRADVPSALSKVITRLMAKDPDARFEDYDGLIEVLKKARPVHARPGGLVARGMAHSLDLLLFGLASIPLGEENMLLMGVVPIYQVFCWTRFGKTLGHRLFDLLVVDHRSGDLLPAGRAISRALLLNWGMLVPVAFQLWELIFGRKEAVYEVTEPLAVFAVLIWVLLFAVVGFSRDKRGIHDRLTGSHCRYDLAETPGARKKRQREAKRRALLDSKAPSDSSEGSLL